MRFSSSRYCVKIMIPVEYGNPVSENALRSFLTEKECVVQFDDRKRDILQAIVETLRKLRIRLQSKKKESNIQSEIKSLYS